MTPFDNLKNLTSLMGKAKQLREKADQLQKDLGNRTVEAESGAGAVRVVANGRLEIISVHIDRAMLRTLWGGAGESDSDHAMIEDLVASATNAALAKARGLIKEEMSRLAGGLDLSAIPGLEGLLS